MPAQRDDFVVLECSATLFAIAGVPEANSSVTTGIFEQIRGFVVNRHVRHAKAKAIAVRGWQ
jgi:hypothetical protein